MDSRANSDLFFLTDEKFDFDVSLSPASSAGDEDEDEVFVGPVSHKEKCVSVKVASRLEGGSGGVRTSWSPLTGDQLDAVCQEAHRLATQLQNGEDQEITDTTANKEEFVQDTVEKLGVLSQTARVLSPIKRETFCVQDSPMKQLPPAIQHQLLRGSGSKTASSTRFSATNTASSTRPGATNTASSTRPGATKTASSTRLSTRLSTSSPIAGKAQPKMALRGKASLGVGVVLPSKPAAPTTLCLANKNKADKTRLQPPSKSVVGWRRSPTHRPSSRAESYEDLLSDSASIASDMSDSSLNSSLLGKRTLAPPTKCVRNISGVKAPPHQNRRVTDRKNTSSSSSSVSSFNSSMSLSPAKGKPNSSLNRSTSVGNAPSSVSRPANPSRTRRSTVYSAAETGASAASRRSLSTQARKPSEAEHAKAGRSTPLKRTDAMPTQQTSGKRVLERTTSIPAALVRPQSGLMAKPKPEALVVPTPSGGGKGVPHAEEVSKMLKPTRLMSLSSLDSLPQKPSAGPLTPSAGDVRMLQVKARRPSALPTPVRRKTSAAPTTASQARLLAASGSDPAPGSETRHPQTQQGKENSCSPIPTDTQEMESADSPEVRPFSLEEEEEMEIPAASPRSDSQSDQSESTDCGAPSQDQSEPGSDLIELDTAEESNSKTHEVLLLDLPAPALQPQEKLLIDLTNTPDLIRTSSKTCTTTQLIDLSSPLIKWSPQDKNENGAPLINLSF